MKKQDQLAVIPGRKVGSAKVEFAIYRVALESRRYMLITL